MEELKKFIDEQLEYAKNSVTRQGIMDKLAIAYGATQFYSNLTSDKYGKEIEALWDKKRKEFLQVYNNFLEEENAKALATWWKN